AELESTKRCGNARNCRPREPSGGQRRNRCLSARGAAILSGDCARLALLEPGLPGLAAKRCRPAVDGGELSTTRPQPPLRGVAPGGPWAAAACRPTTPRNRGPSAPPPSPTPP